MATSRAKYLILHVKLILTKWTKRPCSKFFPREITSNNLATKRKLLTQIVCLLQNYTFLFKIRKIDVSSAIKVGVKA